MIQISSSVNRNFCRLGHRKAFKIISCICMPHICSIGFCWLGTTFEWMGEISLTGDYPSVLTILQISPRKLNHALSTIIIKTRTQLFFLVIYYEQRDYETFDLQPKQKILQDYMQVSINFPLKWPLALNSRMGKVAYVIPMSLTKGNVWGLYFYFLILSLFSSYLWGTVQLWLVKKSSVQIWCRCRSYRVKRRWVEGAVIALIGGYHCGLGWRHARGPM